jgi:hypothetical protein
VIVMTFGIDQASQNQRVQMMKPDQSAPLLQISSAKSTLFCDEVF